MLETSGLLETMVVLALAPVIDARRRGGKGRLSEVTVAEGTGHV
jgi:hypothetical protein